MTGGHSGQSRFAPPYTPGKPSWRARLLRSDGQPLRTSPLAGQGRPDPGFSRHARARPGGAFPRIAFRRSRPASTQERERARAGLRSDRNNCDRRVDRDAGRARALSPSHSTLVAAVLSGRIATCPGVSQIDQPRDPTNRNKQPSPGALGFLHREPTPKTAASLTTW